MVRQSCICGAKIVHAARSFRIPGSGCRLDAWNPAMRASSTANSRMVGSGGALGRAAAAQGDPEDSGGVLGDGVDGGGVRRLPRRAGDVEDAAGGGGVEGEAFAQIVGAVEPALLDAQPGLQDPEELLDDPPPAVAADGGLGVLRAGLPPAGEQQPGRGLRPRGRVRLGGGDREHRQVRLPGPLPGRRHRSAVASRCGSRMSSMPTSGFDSSRQAALRSASPGNISGTVRPGLFSHAAPIRAMRSRIRVSGWALQAHSRAAHPVPSGSAGSGAHPIALAGARPSSPRQFLPAGGPRSGASDPATPRSPRRGAIRPPGSRRPRRSETIQ